MLCCEGHITHVDLISKHMMNYSFSASDQNKAIVTAVVKEASSFIFADDRGDVFYLPFNGTALRPIAFPLTNSLVACALAADSTHLYIFSESGPKYN